MARRDPKAIQPTTAVLSTFSFIGQAIRLTISTSVLSAHLVGIAVSAHSGSRVAWRRL